MTKQNNQFVIKRINLAANNFMEFLMREEIPEITQEQILEIKHLLHGIIMLSHKEKEEDMIDCVSEMFKDRAFVRIASHYRHNTNVKEFIDSCCIYDIRTDEAVFDDLKECICDAIEAAEFLLEVALLLSMLMEAETALDDRPYLVQVLQAVVIPTEWKRYAVFYKLERISYLYSQTFIDEIEDCN